MSLKVRKFNAQVKDPQSGQMVPAGLLSSDSLQAIEAAESAAITEIQQKGAQAKASIPDDYTELSESVDELKESLINYTGDFQSGYIKTDISVGDTVNTSPVSGNSYKYFRTSCKKGDTFILSGLGASAARILTFTDENNVATFVAPSAFRIVNSKIIAPNDGYIIINISVSETYSFERIINNNEYALEIININEYALINSYIADNVDVGTVVPLTPTKNTGYDCAVIPCTKGDQFLINAGYGGDNGRLWAFLDTDKKLISVATISEHINNVTGAKVLYAPDDGYFIYNSRRSEPYSLAWKKNYIDISKIETDLGENVISETDANNISRTIDYTDAFTDGYINDGVGANAVIDITNATAGATYKYCVFGVKSGDYIILTGTGANAARLWAFLDSNRRLLSVAVAQETMSNSILQVAVDGYCVINVVTANQYNVKRIINGYGIARIKKETDNNLKYYLRRNYNIAYANAPRYLRMANYLGNYQNVHPKVLYIESGFAGHNYWMAYSPYPGGNVVYENPCVAYSDDGYTWIGIADNPLATGASGDYYSDTHLVLRGSTLECWYREANTAASTETLWRRTTTDGITWTPAEQVMQSTGSLTRLLSPSIIWDATNNKYLMWVVSSLGGYAIKYYEGDTNAGNWQEIRRIDLTYSYNDKNYTPWHADVIIDNNQYIMLIMCKDAWSANANEDWMIFIATSSDNESYAAPYAVMIGNRESWDVMLYRSSLVKIGNIYRIYYSAKNAATRYSIGITESTSLAKFVGAFDELSAYGGRYPMYLS